jgi:VWFA-related protein
MPRRAAALTLLCAAALAQQQQTFRVQSKVVQVPVIVTDKEGRNIDGLRARDFAVLDNGVPQEITLDDFSAGLPPIALVVAVQCSQTSELALADVRRIGAMIQPIVTGQRGEVSVVAFDRDIQWLQDFTRNDSKIHDAILSLHPGSVAGARIFDTIAEAAERMRPRPGRKMLLLISQSNDSGSHSKLEDAIEAVAREGIEVFAAHYSSYAMAWIAKPEDFPEKSIYDRMFFTELARIGKTNHVKALALATGGADYSFARQQGIDKAMLQLGAEVHSQYILSFPQHEDALGMHQIDVSIPGRADLRIRSRHAYWVSHVSQWVPQ